jgi:hypothetical protein
LITAGAAKGEKQKAREKPVIPAKAEIQRVDSGAKRRRSCLPLEGVRQSRKKQGDEHGRPGWNMEKNRMPAFAA